MNVTFEWWQFVGGMAVIIGAVWTLARRMKVADYDARLMALEKDQEGHEDVCSVRYQQIADNHKSLQKAVDDMAIMMMRLADKLDRIAERV